MTNYCYSSIFVAWILLLVEEDIAKSHISKIVISAKERHKQNKKNQQNL